MKVLPTQTEAAAQRPAETQFDDASTASFKSVLASASTDSTAKAGTDVTTTATDEAVPAGVKLHKGEKIEHVEGHAYAEVTSGDRDGMFINTSGNVRNGQAFVLVRKHGKEYHIYGTGKDRLVVGFHMPSSNADETSGTSSAGRSRRVSRRRRWAPRTASATVRRAMDSSQVRALASPR